MSIIDQFGKRKQQDPNALTPRPTPAPQYEKTAQALAFVTRLNDECEALREENGRLRADLNLARMRCADVEHSMHAMRSNLEAYRRYSVEVRTHLQHICDSAQRANEAAIVAGDPDEKATSEQAERIIADTERELRQIASEEIAAKYGANGGTAKTETPDEIRKD